MRFLAIGLLVVLLSLITVSGYFYYDKYLSSTKKDSNQDTSVSDSSTSIWGRIANSGHENGKTRGAFFFAGPPNGNEALYTRHPRSDMWNWSDSNDVKAIFDEMENAGVNVVKLSWWGYGDAVKYSPTLYTKQTHTDAFAAAKDHDMLVAPVIEVGPHFKFWEEFPNDTSTMENLVEEYLTDHGSEQNWLEIYNKDGEARKVIWLIETIHSSDVDTSLFASTFDSVADDIYQKTGYKIGFVIDPTPLPADSTAYYGPDCDQLKTKESILAINPFNVTSDSGTEAEKLNDAEKVFAKWGACAIPFITDLLPGFDDHIVRSPNQVYGNNDAWRAGMEDLALEYETAGVSLDIWNGFTEGYAFTPTLEDGNANYQLAKNVFDEIVDPQDGEIVPNIKTHEDSGECESIDANDDGKLTIVDFRAFVEVYNTTCTSSNNVEFVCGAQDKNGDGIISLIDFASFVKRYNQDSCAL